jgi:putative tryptophan/tyrosine transport system substrate-binding protein
MRQFRMSNCELPIGSTAMFIVALALALLVAPLPSHGQQPAKVYRISWFGGIAPPDRAAQGCPIKWASGWDAWVEELRERGFIRGQNLVIECRFTEGREERAPALAAELVSLKVDLILANGNPRARAAKEATSAIPVVMVYVMDPLADGLVASLAHPGANVTGVTFTVGSEIVGKLLELLKETVPTLSRVAVLKDAPVQSVPTFLAQEQALRAAARALGLTLQFYEVGNPKEFEGTFTAMTKAREKALLMLPGAFVFVHAQRIAELAAKSRLPAVYPYRPSVEAGGLMAYGANVPAMYRRAATYVDKILQGTKPADLPVEQPTKFDLIINLKAAKALGLRIPQSLLSRADEVIQ